MKHQSLAVIYWDTSAVISALFRDAHSDEAWKWSRTDGVHLLSTLALAESHAVIARLKRERILADVLITAALQALENGPWYQLHIAPSPGEIRLLAEKWPLPGADLWHLAAAKTVQKEIPEINMLAFDSRLLVAAEGEGLLLTEDRRS
jgi:predicted nucleic acid-binding protein